MWGRRKYRLPQPAPFLRPTRDDYLWVGRTVEGDMVWQVKDWYGNPVGFYTIAPQKFWGKKQYRKYLKHNGILK